MTIAAFKRDKLIRLSTDSRHIFQIKSIAFSFYKRIGDYGFSEWEFFDGRVFSMDLYHKHLCFSA